MVTISELCKGCKTDEKCNELPEASASGLLCWRCQLPKVGTFEGYLGSCFRCQRIRKVSRAYVLCPVSAQVKLPAGSPLDLVLAPIRGFFLDVL